MSIPQLEPGDVQPRLGEPGFVLLDCREPEELEIARVEGCQHIPMQTIPDRLEELKREDQIVVMCHHGVRAMRVAHFLLAEGFENVASLRGGIHAWSLEVDSERPTVLKREYSPM